MLENQPRVYDNYPHLLAEMFAYSLAAAHLNRPHRVAQGFMVSDTKAAGEGWKVIDDMEPKEQLCKDFPLSEAPHVVHYCQRYILGKYFIGKYRLRKDFISCHSPLLMEPPTSIVEKNYFVAPDGMKTRYSRPVFGRRHAFMVCTLIPGLNEAATYFKDHHCEGKGNYDKTYIFHSRIEE
jgi:peptidyl serine alpha-galactosyltransferase